MLKKLNILSDLIKYRLSLAVAFSSVAGYFLYTNTFDNRLSFLFSGVFLLSAGSAALNQFTERKTDLLMDRTKERPVPSKKISKDAALIIAIMLLLSGSAALLTIGKTPFFLGLITVLFYNLIYTFLKKITILSIIPGAIVGALPPMIGFASGGGSIFHLNILAFSAFMFAWQIPHFWLIIIKYGNEYRAAGFPTVSKYMDEKQIKHLVFFWVLLSNSLLFSLCYFLDVINKNGVIFLSLLNLLFIILFYRMLFVKSEAGEIKGAFILLNSFGFLVMLTIIAVSVSLFF
jgi:heme o synthase